MSASAPFVIAPVEMIVVFYKNRWKKTNKGKSDVTRDEFMAWTNGMWTFNGESKKRIGHPAPFPRELPRRCIKLFSYTGDTILDPFNGSGTTLLEASANERTGIGFDIALEYCELTKKRLQYEKEGTPMPNQKNVSQSELILSYFQNNAERDISHTEIVDWAIEAYKNQTGQVLRDPDRMVRQLHQKGQLIKVSTGVYKYSSSIPTSKKMWDE